MRKVDEFDLWMVLYECHKERFWFYLDIYQGRIENLKSNYRHRRKFCIMHLVLCGKVWLFI